MSSTTTLSWYVGNAAGAQQHEILDLGVLHFARTENRVLERRHPVARHAETNRPRDALSFLGGALRLRQIAARAGDIFLEFDLRRRLRPLALPAASAAGISGRLAVAGECRLRRQAGAPPQRGYSREALRLEERALVPFDSEPLQPGEDAVDQFRAVALDIGVLDAQQHRAALVPGKKPVEQRGARAAHVEIAGRRRARNGRVVFATSSCRQPSSTLSKPRIVAELPGKIESRQASLLAGTGEAKLRESKPVGTPVLLPRSRPPAIVVP